MERCLEFSVTMSASPISPDAAADAAEANSAASAVAAVDSASVADASKKVELGTREEAAVEAAPCFSMGTVPLPLDFSDAKGGSQIMGGPLGQDGRLLMRTHVMLTDMHDGRKKVYLRTDRRALQMKVAITMSGYARLSHTSQLAFSVHPSGLSKAPELEPTETWSFEQGWERVYNLDGSSNGYWLTFHHEHRERSESACVHFGLILEVHPTSDVPRSRARPPPRRARRPCAHRRLLAPASPMLVLRLIGLEPRHTQGRCARYIRLRSHSFSASLVLHLVHHACSFCHHILSWYII